MSNLCTVCHTKPRWYDNNTRQLSPYCSNTCRSRSSYTPQPVMSQGDPKCQICQNRAFNINSPGCCISHRDQAYAMGFRTPRYH